MRRTDFNKSSSDQPYRPADRSSQGLLYPPSYLDDRHI